MKKILIKGRKIANQFKKVLHIFHRLSADEQVDFKEWIRDVLRNKVIQHDSVDEFVKNLDKGDEDDMTYALERYLDELVEEKTQEVEQKRKKADQERKKIEQDLKKAEQERNQERLAREKAERELQELRKMLDNKDLLN